MYNRKINAVPMLQVFSSRFWCGFAISREKLFLVGFCHIAERMNEELNDDIAALEREANALCAVIVWSTIYWSVLKYKIEKNKKNIHTTILL